MSEEEYPIILNNFTHEDSDSSIGTTDYQTPYSDEPQSNRSLSSDDDHEDLQWDMSPEQYQLAQDNYRLEPPSAPVKKTRRLASSEPCLMRSNAFRKPHHQPRKSRIPLPTSPSAVNTHEVNDISVVVQQIPTLVYTNSSRSRRTSQRLNYRTLHHHGRTELMERTLDAEDRTNISL